MSKINRIFTNFLFSLKNIKVREQFLLLTYFDIFNFLCTLLLKAGPNFDLKNGTERKAYNFFIHTKLKLGLSLLIPELSYAQLFNWCHANACALCKKWVISDVHMYTGWLKKFPCSSIATIFWFWFCGQKLLKGWMSIFLT